MRRGLIASRDELKSLRDRLDSPPMDRIYESLQNRCAMILQSPPITQAQWQMNWAKGMWASAVQVARTAQGRILDLLIAHHIEPNLAFRDRAIEELKDLAGWTSWRDPGYADLPADLCTAEAAVAAVVGLDWLWEDLADGDRQRILQAVRTKAIEPYHQAVRKDAWWYTCYHSWNAVCNAGCGLAALALGDQDELAATAYGQAREGLRHFFDALGKEGGWDEGIGYWGYAMRYLLLLAEASWRLEKDHRLFHARGMDATGLFAIYFTPNGQPASFGDGATAPLYGSLYLLARRVGQRQVTWWLDTYAFHEDVQTAGWSSTGLAMIFRPPGPTPKKLDLEPARAFGEIGWAAMADRWPQPSFYAALKTGDLSASHSQRDMNALQVQVDAEMLLSDSGSPAYSYAYLHGNRESFYQNQAQAHNTVTVAGRDHLLDARGEIVESRGDKDFRLLVGAAGTALGEDVRFTRSVLMLLGRRSRAGEALVVLDDLGCGSPESAELFWHTYGRVELDEARAVGVITGQKGSLHVALAATAPLKVRLHKAPADHEHRVIRASAGIIERLCFASVFSRVALGPARCLEDEQARLIVAAGPLEVRFQAGAAGRWAFDSFSVRR
jgi:hypothetical protein